MLINKLANALSEASDMTLNPDLTAMGDMYIQHMDMSKVDYLVNCAHMKVKNYVPSKTVSETKIYIKTL